MLLTPRYDEPSFFRFELALADPAVPLLRQRRRLASLVGGLDDAQWATASRCDGWSVQDVIAHLVSANQFWAFSIRAALEGKPSRFLATFDPVASPAELVEAVRSQPSADVLARFVETNESLAAVVAEVGDDGWSTLGEAPQGHVPLRAVALHALWDSWVHERDVVLPLGLIPVEEPDEIAGCLVYVAALSPAFVVAGGARRQGAIAVEAADPDVRFLVDVGESVVVRAGDVPAGALCLTGPAVELLEALSFRGPLPCPVADDMRWLLSGLAAAFDREP
ncbi:MAG TPA: maleylpyruvate isomerase family mycothiol-dependent enzyme [Jiangellaceae bacterium]|nr:maleylpyruvate isomerase family mycothiol-dependent enzyme [Jiangellaceae bacterium]